MGLNLVGNPNIYRRDITRKITGQAVYSYDLNPNHIGLAPNTPQDTNLLFMGLVRCPYPRANILSIDTSKAEAAGYVTLTAEDLPPYTYWAASGRQYGLFPLPGRDPVLYSGQPVAAVAAPTTDAVVDALALIDVQYEPLPFVLDQEVALEPSAPQLFPGGPNNAVGGFTNETGPIPAAIHYQSGDAQSALAAADVTIGYPVPVRIETQLEQHYEFEPYGQLAMWVNNPSGPTVAANGPGQAPGTATGATLFLWGDTQWAHVDRSSLASYFGLPVNNVVVRNALGGIEGGAVLGMGLGDKLGNPWIAMVAAMSKKAGMAVKFGPTRSDHEITMNHRFPTRGYVSLGAKSDGTLTAMKITLYINVGCYGGSQGADAISDFLNLYDVPNVLIDSYSVNTDAYRTAGAMRDVGESQGHWIMERAIDQLAMNLNMDPYQFRLKNGRTRQNAFDPTTSNPLEPGTGFPYTGWGLPEALIEPATQFNWSSKWQGWGQPSLNGTKLTGVGISLHNAAKGSISPPSTAQIQLNSDGSITAFTGLTDHGAGGNTTFAIMAAESVGLTPAQFGTVKMVQQDTSLNTDSGGTFGSRSTRVAGMAFLAAAENLAGQVFPVVAKHLGVPASTLAWSNGGVYQIGNSSVGMTLQQVASLFSTPPKGYGTYIPPAGIAQRVGGAKLFEVTVDIETAEVAVVNYTLGMDLGKVIFHNGAMSQGSGGLFMGIGETLLQERWNDPTTGININPNFHDFRIATIMEIPQDVLTNGPTPYMDGTNYKWVEYIDPVGPYGAKGIGENCLISLSPALGNALTNALGGAYQFNKLPITKADIVAGINAYKKKFNVS
jgi:CO/xanthine dehydrogenase Mo-binding subunit